MALATLSLPSVGTFIRFLAGDGPARDTIRTFLRELLDNAQAVETDAASGIADAATAQAAADAAQADATTAIADAATAQGDATQALADAATANGFLDQSVKTTDTPLFSNVRVSSGAAVAVGGGADDATSLGVHRLVVAFTNFPIPMADEVGVVAFGGVKVADLPAGALFILGATANLAVTKSSAGVIDTWDGDFAVGTAAAANDATLTGTEADLIPSTATPQAVAGATTAKGQSTGTEAGTILDGTGTAKDLFVNFVVDDADHDVTGTPCNLILNGSITLTYANLGDY